MDLFPLAVKLEATQLPQVDSMIDLIPIIYSLNMWTFCLNMSVLGQTGLYDGPVPYDGATRYANAKPVSKDSQSGNPGFVSTGVAPEVISYGYGGYPFANMDVAESNTAPSGSVDGPVPHGAATRYANAKPVSKDFQ
ncbi:hypothetical protein F7725_013659 [Dissostichus mawsoni]|uniref:Uncharacterized protein n=1 Tax=Dissostichus mawsoni TaxID=36200 RepID=A0A7J5YVX0_DISMA|nr:hypothetical protein F7725_013659 [Dissostichus mawsoni]